MKNFDIFNFKYEKKLYARLPIINAKIIKIKLDKKNCRVFIYNVPVCIILYFYKFTRCF